MKTLPIDDYKRGFIDSKISFHLSGHIRINSHAGTMLRNLFDITLDNRSLHFAMGDDKSVYITVNNDKKNGLKLNLTEPKSMVAVNKGVVKYLTKIMDLPLGRKKPNGKVSTKVVYDLDETPIEIDGITYIKIY